MLNIKWQQNLLRTYKGNKLLLRCFIPKTKTRIGTKTVQIYNEDEEELTIEDIDKVLIVPISKGLEACNIYLRLSYRLNSSQRLRLLRRNRQDKNINFLKTYISIDSNHRKGL